MPREEEQHKIEAHVAGICFRETDYDIEVLIVKRNDNREIYPGKWECGGGQVYMGENFEEAIKRQMREELGVIVEKAMVFGVYDIETPQLEQKKIPGVRFICFFKNYANGKGPQIDSREHSEWRWQSINDIDKIDFAPHIKSDIQTGWKFYSKYKNI